MRAMQKVIQIIAAHDICAKKHCTMPLYCTIMFAIFFKLFILFCLCFHVPYNNLYLFCPMHIEKCPFKSY